MRLTSRFRSNPAYEPAASPRFYLSTKTASFPNGCQIHNGNELSYFCESCNTGPFCPECIMRGLHRDHKVTPLKNMLDTIKAKINGKIMQCNKIISSLEDNSEVIESEKGRIFSEGSRIKLEIKSNMMDLEKIISEKQEVLNQHIDRIIQSYTVQLNSSVGQLREERTRLMQYRKDLQDYLYCGNDIELVNYYAREFSFEKKIDSRTPINDLHFSSILNQSSQESLSQFISWIKQAAKEVCEFPVFSFHNVPETMQAKEEGFGTQKIPQTPQNSKLERLAKFFERTEPVKYQRNEFKYQTDFSRKPLNSLEMNRIKKITNSPSFLKYLELKNTNKLT